MRPASILFAALGLFAACTSSDSTVESGGQNATECAPAEEPQESQRKFEFADDSTIEEQLASTTEVGGLTVAQHAQYTYYDVYLDTKDRDLFREHLSLRFRRRHYDDDTVEYGMQLKS